ncbi:MAG: hypothetical protein GXO21_02725, partial [Aquificae bacterium]|nr:hypothetical protein [Aquificota bacterium]
MFSFKFLNIFSLLSIFAVINMFFTTAKSAEFYVDPDNPSVLSEILSEASMNNEDDIIYFKPGVYDLSLDLIYEPAPTETYSLTFKPAEKNKLVLINREASNFLFKGDFSNVETGNDIKIIFEDISFLDVLTDKEKEHPMIEIVGENLDIKLKNCSFLGNFINNKNSTINLKIDNSKVSIVNNIF